jgi:hypothetical protein
MTFVESLGGGGSGMGLNTTRPRVAASILVSIAASVALRSVSRASRWSRSAVVTCLSANAPLWARNDMMLSGEFFGSYFCT